MSEQAASASARILYIDDDPGLQRLVQRALEARGYTSGGLC
jgi:ActR/RegA family two-component response regulator